MSIKVKDNRIVLDTADTATGWTGAGGSAQTTPRVEGTNAYVGTLNTDTGQVFFTNGTPIDMTNTLIYVWSNNFALQGEFDDVDPPNAMYVGDGTNGISFKIAGSDVKVFTHLEENDWNWDCLVLDTVEMTVLNSAGLTVERAGTFAAFDTSSITQVGADFTTLSKGLGGGTNVAVDIIRYGNDGLTISSGSSTDPGTFLQVVAEDRSTGSLKAHGIIREYTTNLYGVQGGLTFGSGSEDTYFSDDGVTVVYENRNIADDKYFFDVTGSTSFRSEVLLNNVSIATAGPWVSVDMSSDLIDTLEITNCSFNSLSGSFAFATGATGSTHLITDNSFVRPGPINLGSVTFDRTSLQLHQGVTVEDSASLVGVSMQSPIVPQGSSSLYWNVGTDTLLRLDDMSFDTGSATVDTHAITYGPNVPTSMSLDNVAFIGYGANGTSGSALFNDSGKDLQITILGEQDTPTTGSSGGNSITLITNVRTLTLENIVSGSEVSLIRLSDNTEIAALENVDTDGLFTYSYSYTADIDTVAYVHNIEYIWESIPITLGNADQTVTVQQTFDRNYLNPE